MHCLCYGSGVYASAANAQPDKEHQALAPILIVSFWISLLKKNVSRAAWSLAGSFTNQMHQEFGDANSDGVE